MKDLAPVAEPAAPSHSDLRLDDVDTRPGRPHRPPSASTDPPAPPEATPAPAPSLLDHLRRGRLADAWSAVTRQRPEPLPGRAGLERRFGTSLGHVRVHSGPAARGILDLLGAQGAAAGRTVLLRDRTGAGAVTAAHEVAHVLQAPSDTGVPHRVLPHHHPAEREAEALATGVLAPPSRGQVGARLPVGAVALRRPRQRPSDAAAAPPARGTDVLDRPESLRIARRDRSAGGTARGPPSTAEMDDDTPAAEPGQPERGRRAESDEPGGDEPEASEPAGDAPGSDEAVGVGDGTGPAAESAPGGARAPKGESPDVQAAGGGAAPDRRRELREDLDATQERWDEGATEADQHEVEPCPEHANQPGTRPFARGPPLTAPATREGQPPEPAEPAPVPRRELDRAQRSVVRQVERAPARAPPRRTNDLDAEERAELVRARTRLDGAVRRDVQAGGPQRPADERLELSGDADPARIDRERDLADGAITGHATRARDRAGEDFGESVMAPATDPTTDLDTGLDALEVPRADVDAMVDTSRLDLVATEANVGAVPVDQVVLVTDAHVARAQEHAETEAAARRTIDTDIARGDRDVDRHCARARVSRARTEEQVRRGVGDRRGRWTADLDRKVAQRDGEARGLVRTHRSHVQRVQRDTDRDAGRVLDDARQDADQQWSEAERRATNKAQEPQDRSWFRRGIDWLRSAIADLVSWIDTFIDLCRQAIDALLDAAKAVAHGIIEAGRRAITVTIDGLHAGLDLIADNLPGELGEIAREHRDDLHRFLDERQADVDAWADALHEGVDETIEGLREELQGTLDDFQDAVHEAAELIDEFLEHGLMAFLRAHFPLLATLVDEGLLAPVRWASDVLGDWLDSALEATGIRGIQEALAGIDADTLCEPPTEEQQAEDCEAFRANLEGALETVDALLASPIAQRIQAFLTEQRDETAAQQVDAASGFFSFISAVARPVYEWWQEIEPTVRSVLDELGDIASTIWRHVAEALGIDPNLSPLEALQQGLEALWDAVSEAVAPIVDGIKQAWDWLRNQSFLAPVFDFFAALPELWDALTSLVSRGVDAAGEWLTHAIDTLKDTILPALNRVANRVADLLLSAVDAVEQWVDGLIAGLDLVLAFQAANAFVELLVEVVGFLVSPIRTLLVLFKGCALRAWRWLANGLRDLGAFLRTLLDVLVGLALALLTFPIGLVAFLAGNVWLHLVPRCYKGALIDFFLDLAIRFLRFLPEPADFVLLVVYQGALNFLLGIRAASDEQKIGAVDLFASIFAGNVEVLAGFLVGLAEGVWESTGGTIVFLLRAVVWLVALPFKLAQWGVGLVRGRLADGAGAEDGEATAADPPSRRRRRSRARAPPDRAEAEAPDTDLDAGPGADGPRDGHEGDIAADGIDEEVAAEPADLAGVPRDEPTADHETSGGLAARDERLDEPAGDRAVDGVDAEIDAEVDGEADGGAEGELAEGEAVGELVPPAAPAGLGDLRGAVQKLVTEGLSRADVVALLEGARSAMRSMVGRLARDAATTLLNSLNARGAAFAIGRTIGSIVGQLIVEVLLAVFTGGASAGVTAAKAAITGARVTTRFASVIAKVKRALEPLLGLVQRLRGALGDLIRGVRRWLDDVLAWMRGVTRRVGNRLRGGRGVRGPRGPHGPHHGPHHGPQGGRQGGRPGHGRDGPDGRRRHHDDHESPGDRRRRRLRGAIAYMRPRLLTRLLGGMDRRRLRRRLTAYRRLFGLTALTLPTRHGRGVIVARINPRAPVVQEYDASQRERLEIATEVADGVLIHETTVEAGSTIFGSNRAVPNIHGEGGVPAAVRHERGRTSLPNPGTVERRGLAGFTVQERRAGYPSHSLESRRGNALVQFTGGGAHSYPALAQVLDGLPVDNRELARALQRIASGQTLDPALTPNAAAHGQLLAETVYLMFVREGVRDPRSLVWGAMTLDLMERGNVQAFTELMGGRNQIGLTRAGRRARALRGLGTGGLFPPSQVGFVQRVRQLNARILAPVTERMGRGQAAAERRLIADRNHRIIERWARHDAAVTLDRLALLARIRAFVHRLFRLT